MNKKTEKKTDKKALGNSNTKAVKKEVKKADQKEDAAIPKDLRHTKPSGRPSNADRTTTSAMKETIRKTCADILASFTKNKAIASMSTDEKISYLQKMLPFVINEDTQTEGSMTMDLLCKKAARVSIEIATANAEAQSEEDPDDE